VVVFGVLPLPDFVPANEALAESIKPLHEYTAMALALLILLHVAAAIKHQWFDKHALIQRMWLRR
jgi:cytochrome b561